MQRRKLEFGLGADKGESCDVSEPDNTLWGLPLCSATLRTHYGLANPLPLLFTWLWTKKLGNRICTCHSNCLLLPFAWPRTKKREGYSWPCTAQMCANRFCSLFCLLKYLIINPDCGRHLSSHDRLFPRGQLLLLGLVHQISRFLGIPGQISGISSILGRISGIVRILRS